MLWLNLTFAWGCSKSFTKVFIKIESLFKGLEANFVAVRFHLLITSMCPSNEGEGKTRQTYYFWCCNVMTLLPGASAGALVTWPHQHPAYPETSLRWLLSLGEKLAGLTERLGHLQSIGVVPSSSPRIDVSKLNKALKLKLSYLTR